MPVNENRGSFLIEILLATVVLVAVLAVASRFLAPALSFVHRARVRQQVTLDSRQCVETVKRFLSHARAGSIVIRTPFVGAPPNSEVQFATLGANAAQYTISWSSAPADSVRLRHQALTGGPVSDTVIARRIRAIVFTADSRDPSLIQVSLRAEAPLDKSGRPESLYSVFTPNLVIRTDSL